MPIEAGKIRNVAVVGHRGTGKTSLVEALLFQAGKTNRLGSIEAGTTVSDFAHAPTGLLHESRPIIRKPTPGAACT